jgi:hypothetical protein
MKLVRSLLPYLAGLFAMGLVSFAIEALGHWLFPPSPEMAHAIRLLQAGDQNGIQAMREALPTVPAASFLFVLLAWILGAIAMVYVAVTVAAYRTGAPSAADCRRKGLRLGLVLALACASNLISLPHPAWMWPAGLLLPFATALGTSWMMARRQRSLG